MANKIYDFLPGHLKNKELETIFDATLERVFSKGSNEKIKAYVGRTERGIYNSKDIYIDYPSYAYARKNYAFEPVFENKISGDRVFYDDFLNSLFNKGSITTDHHRLLRAEYKTINLPIDIDKFVNYSLYYWVSPGFFTDDRTVSNYKHYVTIDKGVDNWWSNNNAWYHYDDIRDEITPDNSDLIVQAKRPIIEFDNRLELSDISNNKSNDSVEEPTFNLYDSENDIVSYSKLFNYVTGDYAFDQELVMRPKMKAGDYTSEFVFLISLDETEFYKLGTEFVGVYVEGEFNYRNFRDSIEEFNGVRIELSQEPIINTLEVYVDGIKTKEWTYADDNTINLNDDTEAAIVYVDYKTLNDVDADGNNSYQKIIPEIEYNVDNEDYYDIELDYSTVYQHFHRIIDTTENLEGDSKASNNFRQIGDNTDKLRFNMQGSVLVKRDVDIKDTYFSVTNDVYDPYAALEFISSAYNSYKNRVIGIVEEMLNEPGSETKSNTQLLEEALATITRTKSAAISMFVGVDMISMGSRYSHYHQGEFTIAPGSDEQIVPSLDYPIVNDENVALYFNGELFRLNVDYTISPSGNTVTFIGIIPQADDSIVIRNYTLSEDSYMPPSAVKLGISSSHRPRIITDENYGEPVDFILGHDGSKTPVWGNRIDDVLLELENRIWNKLDNTVKTYSWCDAMSYLNYADADSSYSFDEKNYILYPFFKKWMIRNNIDNIHNDAYSVEDWKTWNYKSMNATTPGHWRGMIEYYYGTDQLFSEPWKMLFESKKPENFDNDFGTDYRSVSFWENLIAASGLQVEVPVDVNGNLKSIDELFFNNSMTQQDIDNAKADWEFGDGSPVELAWRRSSEYPFIAFLGMLLLRPLEVNTKYRDSIDTIVGYFLDKDDISVENVTIERDNYKFNLGSKLAGFVNNVKIYTENSGLANSRFTEIPKDNYNLFVHKGEPNRSEFFSAVIFEKVSLDTQYPKYDIANTVDYRKGDIVYNELDKKYYKRKVVTQTDREQQQTINFDYDGWVLISQPKTRKFGYRIHGYDDFNPTFYTLDWDKTSGKKAYSTKGDEQQLNDWRENTYYRMDEYVTFNGQPYVCLNNHTSSTLFDNNLEDWKQLTEAPRTNVITANGYNSTTQDKVKTYNYGDILESIDDVAQMMIGYQDLLALLGWEFTDIDNETNEVVNFESLLYKFLDWTSEKRDIGEFITLSPILFSGAFSAPYGVASVKKETYKNFYRVVDSSGRLINDSQIAFYTNGDKITWESEVPVYGMKIDISDVEHAITFDRVDSYSDVIYDPHFNNRNLRFTLDCNRTSNWDGTLQAEGYIVYGDQMIPNFDTLVEDTRYYRDTMVDQNLEIINRIKARQIGFTQRDYLDNFEVERESQLEFYKGFIAAKGSRQSISSILNNNSNYTDIAKSDVWKIFENDFGVLETIRHAKTTLAVNDINDDPYNVNFTIPIDLRLQSYDDSGSDILFKNSGYVDSKLVNYVVSGENDLNNFIGDSIYEGDLAWIQFDPDRDWDVRRLSEISEINYVGETSDGQLYVVLVSSIDTTDPVFLKIQSDDIDPKINGYYYLILDETLQENGGTVYKYLAFEQSFEPLSVEIDSETSNSVFVPTSDSTTIEAISNISNPDLENGDIIVLNGTTVTYDETVLGSSGILITGSNVLPFVQSGEEIRIIVYDGTGNAINTTTDLEFDSFGVQTTETFAANVGDQINIDGTSVEVQASGTNSISVTSNATDETSLITDETVIVDTNAFTVKDISIVGSVSGVTITTSRPLTINGYQINFIPDTYPSVPNETATVAAPTSSYTISSVNPNRYTPTSVQVDNGVDPVYTLTSPQFTYNSSTGVITFNTAIQDGLIDHDSDPLTPEQGDGTVDLTVVLSPNKVPYSMQDMADEINLATAVTQVSAIINGSGFMSLSSSLPKVELTGSIIQTLGIHTSDTFSKSKLEQLIDDMQALGSTYTIGFTPNLEMQLQTSNPTMNLSGTALNDLGISAGDYFASSGPTLNSVASQIIAAGITGVSAEVIGSTTLKITKNGQTLQVSEITPGAMSRLGFTSTVYNIKSVDYIVERINTVLFANNSQIATASVQNDVVVISSIQSAMTISNISGNALSDIGITPTTYISEFGSDIDAAKLRDQINVTQQEVTVSLTSDSRLVFVTENNSIDFTGTSQAVLDKLGLYQIYTTASSNPNFKVMRWKSVRYTPGVNGDTFSEFFSNLGLNDISYIWADDYNDNGWHVLFLNSLGVVSVHAKSTSIIDTNKVRKLLIKDDNNQFHNYHPYDPLLGIIPGDIKAKLDYITWKDPAKYDYASDKDIWLDERVGEVWWDTTHTRFYRYNDYGNELGIKDISYVKRYWGRIIPGSEVVLKKWTKSNTLPDNVSNYNSYTYYNVETKKTVTNYYFWDEKTTVSGDDSNFDIGELKKLVESDRLVNKFLPIDAQNLIVSDRKQNFIGETIEMDLQYVTSDSRQETTELHKEWAAFSEYFDDYFSGSVYDTVKDSIVNRNINNIETFSVDDLDYNLDANFVIYGSQDFVGLTVNDIVVSSNSNFINNDRLSFDGVQLKIRKDDDIIIGDVIRVYVLSTKENNIFNDAAQARENFAALLNKTFDNIMIDGVIPEWKKYVSPKFSVILDSWSLTPHYKEITKYEYLSSTRDFDMIALFKDGIGSFKVELEKDEYYFNVGGDLRLVNLSDSTLQFNFDNVFDLAIDNDYLSKCVDVQIYELFNMFDHYMNTDFKRQIVRVMINYLFSEIGEHTMDVFKTSEIDVKLTHKPLQQYSIYQRDSIQDVLDYINETKPYHTKIRKVYVKHNTSDDILVDVDGYNEKYIDLKFGTVEEISYPIADMINRTVPDIISPFNPDALAENIDVYADGIKVDKQYWHIDENGNLIIGADDAIFKLSDYAQLTIARRISRYNYDIIDGLSENGSLGTDAIAAEMLNIKSQITDDPGGVDTGFIPTRMLESTVFKIETYEDETQTGTPETMFTVYDQFGRVWELKSDNETTISSITGNQIYVNNGSYFADAKSDSVNMIALETGSVIEFITYNDKDGVKLEIDNRRLFNGLAHNWSSGDKIHSLRLVKNQ